MYGSVVPISVVMVHTHSAIPLLPFLVVSLAPKNLIRFLHNWKSYFYVFFKIGAREKR